MSKFDAVVALITLGGPFGLAVWALVQAIREGRA